MTTSPWIDGYRSFRNLLSPYFLFTEFIHVHIINSMDIFHTPNSLKLRSDYFLCALSRRQTFCGILNLHGKRFHVREDPPVLLWYYTQHLLTLVLASSRVLSLSNDHSPSSSLDDSKPYTFNITSNCSVLSKPNSHSTKALAITFKHQSSFTLARTLVKALLRVVFLVPARIKSLAPSSTPIRLLTMAICSSIDSLLEELLIIFDLTCTKKLPSFWPKALKNLLSINIIYPFTYLMLSLGLALYCCALNFGISDSFYLCTWFLS
ncbi:unnamed protein product [Arabidopsis halleri]